MSEADFFLRWDELPLRGGINCLWEVGWTASKRWAKLPLGERNLLTTKITSWRQNIKPWEEIYCLQEATKAPGRTCNMHILKPENILEYSSKLIGENEVIRGKAHWIYYCQRQLSLESGINCLWEVGWIAFRRRQCYDKKSTTGRLNIKPWVELNCLQEA